MALSTEKENSRRLKNDKLLLQKEVDEMHFQNVLLREKLLCLVHSKNIVCSNNSFENGSCCQNKEYSITIFMAL